MYGIPDFFAVFFRGERTRRADLRTLSAVDAFHIGQCFAEGGDNLGFGAASGEVNRADALNFLAHADAVAAQHTLVRVAGDRGRRVVHRLKLGQLFETDFIHTEPARQILQGAVGTAGAGRAFAFVVGEQQFDVDAAHIAQLQGIGTDFHAVFRSRGA